jgi:hypothetical protein
MFARDVNASRGHGLTSMLCCALRSKTVSEPSCVSVQMRFGSDGSKSAHVPSPPAIEVQSRESTPMPLRLSAGPHQELLSWKPPQTSYGTLEL